MTWPIWKWLLAGMAIGAVGTSVVEFVCALVATRREERGGVRTVKVVR